MRAFSTWNQGKRVSAVWIALLWLWWCLSLRYRTARGGRLAGWRQAAPSSALPHNRRKPPWATDEIVRLAALMPDAGCRHLADVFNRLHLRTRRVSVGKSWVDYTLRGQREQVLRKRRELKHRIPRRMPRNRVWGLDMTGKLDARGVLQAILGIVDHGSRRLLELRVLPRKCVWTLLGYLCLAIAAASKPRAIRTDNEAVFTSRVFCTALRILGIAHQRSDLGRPWQNGRIERLFGTLKAKLDRWQVGGAVQLQLALQQFGTWYKEVRPHRHLHGATPMETWHSIDVYRRPAPKVEWFEAWDGLLTGYWLRC